MADAVLKAAGRRAAGAAPTRQPGRPADGVGCLVGKLAVDAGFAALTVGSHPLADSVGKADNEGMTFDDVLTRVAQITAAVDVPISVDIESGYGEAPTRLIEGLLAVGAVGLNIEDTVHSEGGRLRSAGEHAELVGALRAAADAAGCTWSSTPAPTCSCARTATRPTGSTGRSRGSTRPPTRAPTCCTRWASTTRTRCGA